MDSRIEELAQIILERAEYIADAMSDMHARTGGVPSDRYHGYRSVQSLATEMLAIVNDYRRNHPDQYS